jgi:Xaa-Pro dipeptidase
MFMDRWHRLQAALATARLNCVAAIAGPNLFYLTGLSFHLSERPTVGFFPAAGDPVMVAPALEETKIRAGAPYPIRAFCYDDISGPALAFRQAAQALGQGAVRLGVEFGRMRVMELRWLEAAFASAQIEPAEPVFAGLRMVKDSAEQGLAATLPFIKAGVTERAIAAELVTQMLRAGADAEFPFAPIVASGPNAAQPHALVTDRRLQPGDMLIIDWGAACQGYVADLTRTFALGEVDPEFRRIYELVQAANAAAKAAACPGLTCAAVDAAAREVIAEAGYGEYFNHRVGHGLGLEGHEVPSVHGENHMALQPGVTFTVEPGIYLAGRGGVRIEDDVVITADGCESLSSFPRDWHALPPA